MNRSVQQGGYRRRFKCGRVFEPYEAPWFPVPFRRWVRELCSLWQVVGTGDVVIADLNGEAAQSVVGAIEAKHGAPWLRRRKGQNGVEEIRVVDVDRGVERLATPEEITNGIEYRDYEHFREGKAA